MFSLNNNCVIQCNLYFYNLIFKAVLVWNNVAFRGSIEVFNLYRIVPNVHFKIVFEIGERVRMAQQIVLNVTFYWGCCLYLT